MVILRHKEAPLLVLLLIGFLLQNPRELEATVLVLILCAVLTITQFWSDSPSPTEWYRLGADSGLALGCATIPLFLIARSRYEAESSFELGYVTAMSCGMSGMIHSKFPILGFFGDVLIATVLTWIFPTAIAFGSAALTLFLFRICVNFARAFFVRSFTEGETVAVSTCITLLERDFFARFWAGIIQMTHLNLPQIDPLFKLAKPSHLLAICELMILSTIIIGSCLYPVLLKTKCIEDMIESGHWSLSYYEDLAERNEHLPTRNRSSSTQNGRVSVDRRQLHDATFSSESESKSEEPLFNGRAPVSNGESLLVTPESEATEIRITMVTKILLRFGFVLCVVIYPLAYISLGSEPATWLLSFITQPDHLAALLFWVLCLGELIICAPQRANSRISNLV
eukprot:173981_1